MKTALYRCNVCGMTAMHATAGERLWIPSYCHGQGKAARLYRVKRLKGTVKKSACRKCQHHYVAGHVRTVGGPVPVAGCRVGEVCLVGQETCARYSPARKAQVKKGTRHACF